MIWLIRRDGHSPPTRAEAALAGPPRTEKADKPLAEGGVGRATLFIVIGCIGLAYGADWLVKGAVSIAEKFGISERIIALTIVAFGTSVPELATSIIAALKKTNRYFYRKSHRVKHL